MPAFLTSGGYPPVVDSANELEGVEGMTPIGELRADAKGKGRLSFETPDLPPGDYEIVLFCPACPEFSSGGNVVAVAPFRIPGPQAARDTGSTGTDGSGDAASSRTWAAPVLTLFILSAALLVLAKRNRGDASANEPEAPQVR